MKNNLLNKYLLPSYIAATLFVGAAGTATFFAKKEVQMAKTYSENKDITDSIRNTCFICLLVIMISIIMTVFSAVKYPMTVNEKVKNITKHYLQDIFVRYPEIRQYRFILENSDKLHEIAAIACNGLTDDEQKEILNFVKTELNKTNHVSYDAKLHKIETKIIDIIQKHAAKDPEYMNKILCTIANAQNANFIEAAQKVR